MEPAPRRLTYRPPLDAAGLIRFLAARAVPGVEEVEGFCYRRTFRTDDGACGRLELDLGTDASAVGLRVRPPAAAAGGVVPRCRRLLDLDADPAAVAAVIGADPVLGPLLAANPGLRLPGAWDGFELAARAVLGQQVSVAAARTLLGRLVTLAGATLPAAEPGCAGEPHRLFPTASETLASDLGRLGVPASRRRTLEALAAAVLAGRVVLEPGADPTETRRRLLELPGVGRWTAAYVALRALRDADSLLVGDLALARGAARAGLPGTWPALTQRAEAWRPWRGYASLLLWSA